MQVTRRRRRVEKEHSGLLSHRFGRRTTLVTAGTTAVVVVTSAGISFAQTHEFGTDQVGQTTDNGLVVSGDQYLDPIGDRLVINNGKIMSSAVSPDGTHVAASVTDGG